jgi:hypothetical protein
MTQQYKSFFETLAFLLRFRIQNPGVRSQNSEFRSQNSGARIPESGIRMKNHQHQAFWLLTPEF